MHPEYNLFLPEGCGFIDYEISGSNELAQKTRSVFSDKNVALWEKHGAIAFGSNLTEALDKIETVAKASRIYLMCLSSGYEPEGLT